MVEWLVTIGYTLVTFLVGLVTAAVIYARWHYGTLEKIKGVPVIKPYFIGGSDLQIYKKVVQEEDIKNAEKYGKVYGFYEGREAFLHVADADLIKHIFVKNFDHFQNKRVADFGEELFAEMIDFLPYDKWKCVRGHMSPNLSTGRIKNMSVSMIIATEKWMDAFKKGLEKKNEKVMTKTVFNALTLDVIAKCGFGLEINSLDDPENEFLKHAGALGLDSAQEVNFLLTFILTFPFLQKYLPLFDTKSMKFFVDLCTNVMKSRRESKIKMNDMVDSLNEMYEKIPTDDFKKLKITEITIVAQAIAFFFAGYETTSTTLMLTAYNLAKNPDKQEKLIEEVDAYLARHSGKIEHETLNELVYANACINETLRMFSTLIRLERVCNKDWKDEKTGIAIPSGTNIQVPVFAVHFNPEYYPDPYSFQPERFLPENKDKLNPYAFLGFGLGNHNCVGLRMAKESTVIALTKTMQNFRFKDSPNNKVIPKKGSTFAFSYEPFTVDVEKRY